MMSGHRDQLESTVKSRAAEETGEQAAAETASVVMNGAPAPDTDDRTVSPVSQSVPQKHPSEASPVSTDSSAILHEMLNVMKESISAVSASQKSMQEEFQNLATALVKRTEQTDHQLQHLLKAVKEQNDLLSQRMITSCTDSGVNANDQIVDTSNKATDWTFKILPWPELNESYSRKSVRECHLESVDHYDNKDGLGRYVAHPRWRPLPASQSALPRHSQSAPDLQQLSPADGDLYDGSEEDNQDPLRGEFSRSEGERSPEKNQNSRSLGHREEHTHQRAPLVPRGSQAAQGQKTMDRATAQPRTTDSPPALKTARNAPEKETVIQSETPKRPVNTNQSESRSVDVRPKVPGRTSAVAAVSQPESKAYSNNSRSSSQSFEGKPSRISALGLQVHVNGESESQRLHDAVERARAPDPDPPPKARSFDTVLCLDISSSMWEGEAFQQMIDITNQFINGIEDIVSDSGVEENIALVTFGGTANIVQHLTNDFSRIRDAIERIEVGGKSPFFEAMVVCLTAFHGKGGTVSISGEYDVEPRIIFITDGHITEGSDDPYGLDTVSDRTNTRASFSRLMMDLSPTAKSGMPHPIIFVPVGSKADRNFLQSMATLNNSQMVEPENITSLCSYFKVQGTIGKVLVCMQNKDASGSSEDQIQAVVHALGADLSKTEMAEVVSKVKEELQDPNRKKRRDTKPTNFDEVFEDKEGVMSGHLLPLGTRVVRGPDWQWGNQDSGLPGTVVQHEDKTNPFTWVLWDAGGYNRYPYGPDMGYHVFKTEDHPLLRSEDGQLRIGMTVVKGPKWNLPGSKYDKDLGVVIRKSRDGKNIKVRWANGEIQACPTDAVEFSAPEEDRRELTLGEELFGHTLDQAEEEEEDGERVRAWQWKDDWGDWHLYSQQQTESLERAYSRRKDKSCVIQRGTKTFRVMFRRMIEKDIDQGVEKDVKRVLIPLDEYQSLLVAEELVSSG